MKSIISSPDILTRIEGALERFRNRSFSMRIPVDPTDIDVVLHDAKVEIVALRAMIPQPAASVAEPYKWRDTGPLETGDC
ncbi:hypothetical protein [Burkholderia ubonensis]|uniref:hypothetical protein n=1 Tax=Burkholderia ubonensis TaxID=101571 RepID=UPI0007556979|nr:hypothetical protein [Burkholderia ubonensis]KVO11756.1 hypothetical protein WJ73_19615 [Burkholderia ubonensis]